MDKPNIFGQTVLYLLKEDEHDDELRSNGATELPAIVVKVLHDGEFPTVNLRVFTDSEESPAWRTNVQWGTRESGGTWRRMDD